MPMTLYDHETRLMLLHEQMSEMMERGEEVPAEMLVFVEEYALGAVDKRDACAAVIRRLDSDVEFIGQEIARLSKIASVRAKAAERIRNRILEVMRSVGSEKLIGATATFSVRQNPSSVEVGLPAEALPAEYQRTIPAKVEPDKKAIAAALKAGQDVPGCRMKPGEYRLVIR